MAEQKSPAADPFTAWRDWLSQTERQFNNFFNEMMGTEQYSRAMGQLNDFSLNMQKNMSEAMGRYFGSLNLPTREDLAALGRRLTSIEKRLGTVEGKHRGVAGSEDAEQVAPVTPRPPRTRKPPAARK